MLSNFSWNMVVDDNVRKRQEIESFNYTPEYVYTLEVEVEVVRGAPHR